MTRQRFFQRREPNRVHGPVAINTIDMARARATKLTQDEQTHLLKPATEGFERMRRGQATESDWVHLVTVCAIALAVEDGGVVRGLREVLTDADLTLAAIALRARHTGTWCAPTLYGTEIEHLQTLLRMHAFQLGQISWGEHRKAWKAAASAVVANGGRSIKALQGQGGVKA